MALNVIEEKVPVNGFYMTGVIFFFFNRVVYDTSVETVVFMAHSESRLLISAHGFS